jgi:transposase
MTTQIIAAGVDVGRDFLDVALAPSGGWFKTANAPAGVAAVVERLKRKGVRRVVLESIGPYGARLVRALAGAGFEVGVVDPRRIKALRIAEGGRAKTDRLDARLIARFALSMSGAARPVPNAETLEIRALSTRRRQLVEMAAMEKTRLKQAIDEEIVQSHRAAIAALAAERKRIEAKLATRVRAGGGDARMAILRSAPGVGPAIAVTLLADLPELGTLSRQSAAALAGLAPFDDESGLHKGRASIQGGRSCVRAALYMAALSAVRCEAGYKHEYRAMRAAGKPAKVALIAVARKLLVALNGMVRENRTWKPIPPHGA